MILPEPGSLAYGAILEMDLDAIKAHLLRTMALHSGDEAFFNEYLDPALFTTTVRIDEVTGYVVFGLAYIGDEK